MPNVSELARLEEEEAEEALKTVAGEGGIERLERVFRALFPNGHPDFVHRTIREMQLHDDKSHDYAKGGNPLGNFDRVAKILSMYPNFPIDKPYGVAIVFALKQLDAVLWGLSQKIEHKVEGYDGRCQDISVYFKITPIMIEEDGEKQQLS